MKEEHLRFLRDELESVVLFLEREHEHTWDRKYPIDYVPDFREEADPELTARVLATPEFALYVHVPFCTQKCDFCTFWRPGDLSSFGSASYVACLKAELEGLLRARRDRTVLSVYVGGGTPTMLAPADLKDLLLFIRKSFRMAPDAWVAVETEPAYVDDAMAAALAEGGATDVVIGVQSFNEETLRRSNRLRQTNAQVHEAARRLRAAGRLKLSLDLIYGLSDGETEEDFLRDNLPHVAALQPDTVVVYPLQHYRRHPELLRTLSGPRMDRVCGALREAAPATARRPYHSQYFHYRWSRLKDVVGVGLGAHSFFWPDGRRLHLRARQTKDNDFDGYRRDALAGRLEYVSRVHPVGESMRWYATWNLHRHGLDEALLLERFPAAAAEHRAMLAPLEGLLERRDGLFYLKPDYAGSLPFRTGNDQIDYFLFSFCRLYSEPMREAFVRYLRARDLPKPRSGKPLAV